MSRLSSVCVKHEGLVSNLRDDDDVTRLQFPVVAYCDVMVKGADEEMTSSETTQTLLPVQNLPSSDDVENYFSEVDLPRSQHHHHHHHHHESAYPGYYHHGSLHQLQQQVYAERLSTSQVSYSSLTPDVNDQLYRPLYDYSVEVPCQQVMQTSLASQHSVTNYQQSTDAPSSSSLLASVTCRSMLCYSPSTTSTSHLTDADVTAESFCALLQSSAVTRHCELGGEHDRSADQHRHLTDEIHAADDLDTTSLSFCNLMQPSSCYSDHQMTAWSSSGIVTLMDSFAGSVTEYPSRFVTYLRVYYQ